MGEMIEEPAQWRDRRLYHYDPSTWNEHPLGFLKKCPWNLNVVQHIEHHDIREYARLERKRLRIRHQIEPWRAGNIGRDHIVAVLLKISGASSDFESGAG